MDTTTFLTVPNVAQRLGVSNATVYQLCSSRKLAHLRIGEGRGTIRVRPEDLNKFIEAATVQPDKPAAPHQPPVKLKHLNL